MKMKLALWGASSHAMVIADVFRLSGSYELVGFLDDVDAQRHNSPFCGARVLGGREQLAKLKTQDVTHLFMAFGDNRARLRLSELARAAGYQLATAIHPQAVVASDVIVGAGTAIMAGAVINPGVRIGENVIINTGASIDHECIIEDGAFINVGARLGGNIRVGSAATIEIGSTVGARLTIGADSIIGAGSVVLKSIPEGVLAYGNPAKVVRRIMSDVG